MKLTAAKVGNLPPFSCCIQNGVRNIHVATTPEEIHARSKAHACSMPAARVQSVTATVPPGTAMENPHR